MILYIQLSIPRGGNELKVDRFFGAMVKILEKYEVMCEKSQDVQMVRDEYYDKLIENV